MLPVPLPSVVAQEPAPPLAPVPAPLPSPSPEATRTALLEALANTRKCEAAYAAVLARFGAVEPFLSVVDAERKDLEGLLELLKARGIEVPPNPFSAAPPTPAATLPEACAGGVKLEEATIALYDRLISIVREPVVRQPFERIQAASRGHHLPAFRRCANP